MTKDELRTIVATIFAARSLAIAEIQYAFDKQSEMPLVNDAMREGVRFAHKLLVAIDESEAPTPPVPVEPDAKVARVETSDELRKRVRNIVRSIFAGPDGRGVIPIVDGMMAKAHLACQIGALSNEDYWECESARRGSHIHTPWWTKPDA